VRGRDHFAPGDVQLVATRAGGHASVFRGGERMHRKRKAASDPAGIFNPGRLYAEL
jgi:glycolate oxidase FAD binding subunit